MLLPILLLSLSGAVLSTPRFKGTPVWESREPHYDPHPDTKSSAKYKPDIEIVSDDDPSRILVRLSPDQLHTLMAQSDSEHREPSDPETKTYMSPKPQTFSIPEPQNVPLKDAQNIVPSDTQQYNVPSNQYANAPSSQYKTESAQDNVPQASQYSAAHQGVDRFESLARSSGVPFGRDQVLRKRERLIDEQVGHVLRYAPAGARLLGTIPKLLPIEDRLISNYTTIRKNVTDTFRCTKLDLGYGYYADVENDCQVFHICVPYHKLFPKAFKQPTTYQFSFICNNHTVFSQDSMVCAWKEEALPCEDAPKVYFLNKNFFRRVPNKDGNGTRWAHVNEPLSETSP